MKKKALYEVIIAARPKGYDQLHPRGMDEKTEGHAVPEQAPSPAGMMRWARKPRIVQFNAGRVEFSLPYEIAVAVVLGVVLVVVVAFRVGENIGGADKVKPALKEPATIKPVANKPVAKAPSTELMSSQTTPAAGVAAKQPTSPPDKAVAQAVSTGRNRIVIQTYQVRSHLEPAKEYFDKLGVATEILEKNNWYYLVTKNKYDNPDKAGSDGYLAKQKIIELGAGYKCLQDMRRSDQNHSVMRSE